MTSSRVTIASLPLWRVRLARELPRYVLLGLALFGLAASARFAIDPPRTVDAPRGPTASQVPDRAAEGYAVLFARRYMSWNAAEPLVSARELERFAGAGLETDAGLALPSRGEQRVEWAEVVQARQPMPGEHVYTIAVATVPGGLRYLTVAVVRLASGPLALAGYPAFVGPPASVPAELDAHLRPVDEAQLEVVVDRALGNYLSGSASDLAADLTPGALVSLPSSPLKLLSAQRADWAPGGGAVIVVVQAEDARGVRYTLSYELDVAAVQGRWEVSAVQTEPDV